MATTENLFTGDGSTTNYSFTFEYIDRSDVKADVAGVTTTDFTFANATTLSFDTAPDAGAEIRIYRDTDLDTLKATFFAGSAIKAEDLNNNFTQNNFAVQEVKNNTWDSDLQTIKSNETWVSNDDQIATTAAMDARFQDEVNDTLTKAELAALSDVIPDDDVAVPTTGAVKDYVDHVIETDILVDSTGLNKTSSNGQVTIGISANSVDFDRIKNDDIITQAEQDAGSPSPADSNIFTASAAARRFDTIVQTSTPSGSDWEVGKTWLQNDDDKTLYMWNGTSWLPVVSGGTFTELSKVIYVDSINGDDTLTGHRISNPKKTIKAAVADINADSNGDGSVVVVAPGIYGETFPIDIEKNDIAIVGTSLRNCIIHPAIPAADQAGYDVTVPEANELTTMFRVNSGSYFYGLTLTGMKASGARGGNSLDTDATYGLPTNQGWNFAFYPNAQIKKSPYIQNCTNFSDSKVNNVNFTPHTPGEGSAGDLTSSPTGGGILVNGATVASDSPLRSMVADSYTHTALDGPGIFVTNNGYTQITSSYAFFNHYHIKCLNGGQANLAASTTDFGRYGLLVDGRSTSAIFTATTTAAASDGDVTFTIGAPTADASWHGSATRPQGNMLVDINGNTYPILSATANGSGWDVTISRPNPSKRDENLGLDGAVSSGAAVSFYLRSMIASSGHTMEYVGSGTDYTALPENGGVPIEANQVVELNNGKVWTATTDHNGKFKVGDFFTVDQRTGFVTVPVGSISFPVLAEDLDVNGHNIVDSTGSVTINDTLDLNSNKIVNVTDPTSAQDAATKNYVDSTFVELAGDTMTGALALPSGTEGAPSLSVGTTDNGLYSPEEDKVAISTGGAQRVTIDDAGRLLVGTGTHSSITNAFPITVIPHLQVSGTDEAKSSIFVSFFANGATGGRTASINLGRSDGAQNTYTAVGNGDRLGDIGFHGTDGTAFVPAARITAHVDGTPGQTAGTFVIGVEYRILTTGTTDFTLIGAADSNPETVFTATDVGTGTGTAIRTAGDMPGRLVFSTTPDNIGAPVERMRIASNGNVGIGTTNPGAPLEVSNAGPRIRLRDSDGTDTYGEVSASTGAIFISHRNGAANGQIIFQGQGGGAVDEYGRFDTSGRLLVGLSGNQIIGDTSIAGFQLGGVGNASKMGLANYGTGDADAPTINFGKSKSGTAGTPGTIVGSNSILGAINFAGDDGTDLQTIGAAIQGRVDGTPGTNDMPGRLVFSTTADGASSPTERLRINSEGDFYFNNTNNPSLTQYGTWIAGGSDLGFIATSRNIGGGGNVLSVFGNAGQLRVRGDGDCENTNNSYTGISDIKLKENIVDAHSQWDDLKALQVRNYNFKAETGYNTHTQIGLVAQEVELVSPGLVGESIDEETGESTKSVNYSVLYMKAVKALQEAMERIETLEQRLNDAGIA